MSESANTRVGALDENQIRDLEFSIGRLMSHPAIAQSQGARLSALQSAVNSRRGIVNPPALSGGELSQLRRVMTQLRLLNEAEKGRLELELEQVEQNEERLAELLGRIESARQARQQASPRRSRAPKEEPR